MKKENILNLVLMVIVGVLVVVSTVQAATTISTNIVTEGTITSGATTTASAFVASGSAATSTFSGGLIVSTSTTPTLSIDPISGYIGFGKIPTTFFDFNKTLSSRPPSAYSAPFSENYTLSYGASGQNVSGHHINLTSNLVTANSMGVSALSIVAGNNLTDDQNGSTLNGLNINTTMSAGKLAQVAGIYIGGGGFYGGASTTGYYGLKLDPPYNNYGGRIKENYGIYIGNYGSQGWSTNYALYSAGGVNYFGGDTGVGTTTPTTQLHVTASASNATSTLTVGKVGQNKGTCHEEFRVDGSVIYWWWTAGGAMATSSVSCK